MDKYREVTIEDILNIKKIILTRDDIYRITQNQQTIKDYLKMHNKSEILEEEWYKFLIKNDEYINKENLVLIIMSRYSERLDRISGDIKLVPKSDFDTRLRLQEEYNIITEELIKLRQLAEKMKETVLCVMVYNRSLGQLKLDILNSKDLSNTKRKHNKNYTKYKMIENDLATKSNHKNGIDNILTIIENEDFKDSFINNEIGEAALFVIKQNIANKVNKFKANRNTNVDEFTSKNNRTLSNMSPEEVVKGISAELIEYSEYIDLDKLLQYCAYRISEKLENGDTENILIYKKILSKIIKLINKDKIAETYIKAKNDKEIKFTIEDIEECFKRINGENYISKLDIIKYRDSILTGNTSLNQIDSYTISLLEFSNDEIETMMDYSLDNFLYGADKLNYSLEQIIQKQNGNDNIPFEALAISLYRTEKINFENILDLYVRKLISAEFFKKFSEETNISSEISLNTINQKYLALKKSKEVKNEETAKLDAIIDIYKILNIDGKSIEEQEEASNEVMYQIAEDFEDEEDILFYYNKGLVTLGIVAEWCGESTIEKLYNESKISKEDLINLSNQGKISGKFVEQILLVDDMQYDELMDLIIRGSVSEQKIVDLYMQGKIFDVDFEEMLNNGIISHEEYFTATELRTQEKLEENSKIKLAPILKDIPDKKSLLFDVVEKEEGEPEDWFTGTDSEGTRNVKSLIDPGVRYEFLKMLGAMQAEVLDIDETNAFYNYEFFVIPNSNGEIDLESVVIAERFYVDKETKDRFATDNATYFFQYKDLMVNSNMSKNEMTKERDKIVFRASHRSGIWAVSVLQKLAQTMLSTKFKECTTEKEKDERAEMVLEQLHRILTPEQIKDILDLTGEIDDEEKYTYEIIDGYNTRKDSNKKISDEGFGEL